jgi:hypothetical protein
MLRRDTVDVNESLEKGDSSARGTVTFLHLRQEVHTNNRDFLQELFMERLRVTTEIGQR